MFILTDKMFVIEGKMFVIAGKIFVIEGKMFVIAGKLPIGLDRTRTAWFGCLSFHAVTGRYRLRQRQALVAGSDPY